MLKCMVPHLIVSSNFVYIPVSSKMYTFEYKKTFYLFTCFQKCSTIDVSIDLSIKRTIMATINLESMYSKLSHLSENKLVEVNDFIDFLISKKEEAHLRELYSKASLSAFAQTWGNEEDEVYNEL